MTDTVHDNIRLLADRTTADDLCTAITAARDQLAVADEILTAIAVGDEAGELDIADHADAVHELQVARRALRHLTRIAEAHACVLDELAEAVTS